MASDLRIAVRTLRRQPGSTAIAVVILALGLGATTAMFSLVDAILLRPLPYPDPGRLVQVHRTMAHERALLTSPPTFLDYQARTTAFASMAAFTTPNLTLADPVAAPERVQGMMATADFFPMLGARPLLGRLFLAQEHDQGRNQVVLLGEGLWRRRFAGDPRVVGSKLTVNTASMTVVGVIPASFNPPATPWGEVELWQPMAIGAEARTWRHGHTLSIIARLKDGATISRAREELAAIAADLDRVHRTRSGVALSAVPRSAFGATESRAAWLTVALSLLVLLIACANLAGVQLVRAAGRGHEQAVRTALGATRGRLARQVITESLVISVVGGALGVLVAAWCTSLLAARLIVGRPNAVVVSIDWRICGLALLLALATALLVGILPAWLTTHENTSQALHRGGRGTTDRSRPRLRQFLVAAEMALALVLLAAGGLLLRGLERFATRDLGWKAHGIISGFVSPTPRFRNDDHRLAFYQQLHERLARLPGVESCALAWGIPRGGQGVGALEGFVVEGAPLPAPGQEPLLATNSVEPSYFETLGIALREGRVFDAGDGPSSLRVAIVNETMARRFWPGQSPIGKRIGSSVGTRRWLTIIGVVADIRYATQLSRPATPLQVYQPLRQRSYGSLSITVRASSPATLVPALRRAVAEIDPSLPVHGLRTSEETMDRGLANLRVLGWIVLGFAVLGMVLSALGIYGLFSGYVLQRTREIGVRMALGAQARQVLRTVLGKGLRLALMGGLAGLVGAMAIARVLTSLATELQANDPMLVLALALTLVLVALLACWLPARRAAALDPMVALRQD
jgi:putative ABC transport system permease protein